MKNTLYICAILIVLFFAFNITRPKYAPILTDRVIYIIGVEEYISTDDSSPVYVLGYTINGAYQDPPFRSREKVDSFVSHLKTLGTVIDDSN